MKGRIAWALLVALGVALGARRAPAQTPLPGQRVRVILGTGETMVGDVEDFRLDTLRLGVAETPPANSGRKFAWRRLIAVPVRAIASVQISQGRHATPVRDRIVGGVLGVTFGATMGLASGNDRPGTRGVFTKSAGEKAAFGALGFGALGAGLAGWLGHTALGPETWAPLSVPSAAPAPLEPRVVAAGVTVPLPKTR